MQESQECESKSKIPIIGTMICIDDIQECINGNFKVMNNTCYNECPENSESKSYNPNICICKYNYYNVSNALECYGPEDSCEIKGFPLKKFDNNECFKTNEECKNRGFYIFNSLFYDICPINSEIKSNSNDNICLCKYYFIHNNNSIICFDEGKDCYSQGYSYTYNETNECFETKEDCLLKNYKILNDKCYDDCPPNSQDKNNDKICICLYNYFNNSNQFECFGEEENCLLKEYDYINNVTKECFKKKEDCIDRGYKVFNKECYDECPSNTKDVNDNSICECSFYYYNDSGTLNCFNQNETCEQRNYMIKNDEYQECFTSIEDCFSKEYFYYYNDTCFKNNCASDKILLGSLTDSNLKNELINQLHLIDSTIKDRLCICNTFDNKTYSGWTNNNSNPSLQICLSECPENYIIDEITKRCYFCDPEKDYIFNKICYIDGCPEKTELNASEPNSRICVCKELYKIDNETGLITCIDKEYSSDTFDDYYNCSFIYKEECYSKCPNNTCIIEENEELRKCIDIEPGIKIYDDICFDGLEDILKNVYNISDMAPINMDSGEVVYGYYSKEDKDDLIRKYSNLTYINIDSCIDILKQTYNLPEYEKLYVFVIDYRNVYGNSPINNYTFEIYLENGTQLKDLNSIKDSKIVVSSAITNPDIINYDKGKYFYELGYDIYNKSDRFYKDNCAPASDNGNDITLNDRFKYYYPSNVSLCNEGCEYNSVDYEARRLICDCYINNITANKSNEEEEKLEDDESYLDYFLSLINYKIMLCFNVFLNFSSFYYNAGFYISFPSLMFCLVMMSLFWINGIMNLKVLFYKNVPSKTKLMEIIKKNIEKKANNSMNNNSQRNSIKKSTERQKIK